MTRKVSAVKFQQGSLADTQALRPRCRSRWRAWDGRVSAICVEDAETGERLFS
jgi:hypothetical protein